MAIDVGSKNARIQPTCSAFSSLQALPLTQILIIEIRAIDTFCPLICFRSDKRCQATYA